MNRVKIIIIKKRENTVKKEEVDVGNLLKLKWRWKKKVKKV